MEEKSLESVECQQGKTQETTSVLVSAARGGMQRGNTDKVHFMVKNGNGQTLSGLSGR